MHTGRPINFSAVLFDMDGTLTVPRLDYAAIRRDLGIGPGRLILEERAERDPAGRAAADAVLLRHETEAAEQSDLNAGCRELLDALRGVPLGLVTRNSRRSVEITLAKHGLADRFAAVVTREDEPYKPAPDPLWLACGRLGVAPASAAMVGDGVHDVEAAARAGVRCIWVSHGAPRPFDAVPWRKACGLGEVLGLLEGGEG